MSMHSPTERDQLIEVPLKKCIYRFTIRVREVRRCNLVFAHEALPSRSAAFTAPVTS